MTDREAGRLAGLTEAAARTGLAIQASALSRACAVLRERIAAARRVAP